MKSKLNLIAVILAVSVLGSLTNAQSGSSCTYAEIARGKINEAKQQIAAVEKQIAVIRKERRITTAQMTQISNSLDSVADSDQVAYEAALKSAEYAARTEGKNGDVGILRELQAFTDFKAEKGKFLRESLNQIVEDVNKGSIKELLDKNTLKSKPDMEQPVSKEMKSFVMIKFESSGTDDAVNESNSILELERGLLLPNPQISCFNNCLNKNWGECFKCIFSLACQATGNSSGNSSGNSGNSGGGYQACINNCNSLPLLKRVACKAKCVFS